MRELELLAPAKNVECGKAAIDHGADAVYIGAARFGARAAAGNSVSDIDELCRYAHTFGAKVYVTVNTIIYDSELEDTQQLIQQLAEVGVDAILVQDMALMAMRKSINGNIIFHASTQTDNRTAEKVKWLHNLGFTRVVLARELSIDEIRAIHNAVPDVELEVFVHGALCVSFSGLCYASQYCFSRSANRGECAQFCRMAFDLVDSNGEVIERNRHLLSLRDMNQLDNLEALADAGASSFKIEGRLKDINYVKNVTAAYSQRLDAIVRRHPDRYRRSSLGHCTYSFTPDLDRTFNRGYTTYFANGRRPGIANFDTPKAIGQFVGTVKEIRRNASGSDRNSSFNVAGTASFSNGDGLCFFDEHRQLIGFRINRAEGNRLYPQRMPAELRAGMKLYRSNDQEMERLLSRPSSERKIPITLRLSATDDGFCLSAGDVSVSMAIEHQTAEKPQRENIVRQLSKLGGTPYECQEVELADDFNYFIPSSQLAELRRMLVEKIAKRGIDAIEAIDTIETIDAGSAPPDYQQAHLYNIANSEACRFYGTEATTAYELNPSAEAVLMQCRHCLRYSLGYCVKHGSRHPEWREPLYLRLGDGRRFRLEFDCKKCQMNVYAQTR